MEIRVLGTEGVSFYKVSAIYFFTSHVFEGIQGLSLVVDNRQSQTIRDLDELMSSVFIDVRVCLRVCLQLAGQG